MIDWSVCSAVESDPERVGDAWVFRETCVPVTALFQHLKSGARLDEFAEWFPGVTLAQVRAILDVVLCGVADAPKTRHPAERRCLCMKRFDEDEWEW